MTLSCIIFEIFDVEEYCDLEIWVSNHSLCEFKHDLYIIDLYRQWAIFFAADIFIEFYTASAGKSYIGYDYDSMLRSPNVIL